MVRNIASAWNFLKRAAWSAASETASLPFFILGADVSAESLHSSN